MKKKQTITVTILSPTKPNTTQKLTMDDVWGGFNTETDTKISDGMLVARGMSSFDQYGKPRDASKDICPIWKDQLHYKDCTFVCDKAQIDEVTYWIEYVHGGGAVQKIKDLPGGKVAIRSAYKCW